MTTVSFIALALAVVAVVLLVARQRSLRAELDAARGEASTARAEAAEAARAHDQRDASSQEELAASRARTAEVEAALQEQAAAAEARWVELDSSSRSRIGELERSLHLVKADLRQVTGTAAARATEAEAAQVRAGELETAAAAGRVELEAAVGQVAALQADLAARRSVPARPPRPAAEPGPGDDEAGWRLLLARVERQWADLVNAGAAERGVVDGSRGEQLAEATRRELERLREEVGVETAMTVTGPVDDDHALTTLLVVGEAAALLASRSEHVTVDLGQQTVVTGLDWSGDDEARRRLDQLVATAAAVGRPAAVVPDDGAVRLVLG